MGPGGPGGPERARGGQAGLGPGGARGGQGGGQGPGGPGGPGGVGGARGATGGAPGAARDRGGQGGPGRARGGQGGARGGQGGVRGARGGPERPAEQEAFLSTRPAWPGLRPPGPWTRCGEGSGSSWPGGLGVPPPGMPAPSRVKTLGFRVLRGPVLVPGRTCSGTGPIVGATDPLAAGGGQATWVDFRHRGQRA